jgi:hypothetical protein
MARPHERSIQRHFRTAQDAVNMSCAAVMIG